MHRPQVGVALRRGQARVPEQLLDGAEISTPVEEVGGEGVTQAVTGRALRQSGFDRGPAEGALQRRLVQVMAAPLAGGGVQVFPVSGRGICRAQRR